MNYLLFQKSDSKLKEFKVQEGFACLFVGVNNIEVQKPGLASVVFFLSYLHCKTQSFLSKWREREKLKEFLFLERGEWRQLHSVEKEASINLIL